MLAFLSVPMDLVLDSVLLVPDLIAAANGYDKGDYFGAYDPDQDSWQVEPASGQRGEQAAPSKETY